VSADGQSFQSLHRRSARYSWQRVLHRCAAGRAADAGVAGSDAWGHVVDLVRQRPVGV